MFQCDKSRWSDGRALAAAVLRVAELAGLSAAASGVDVAELGVSGLDVSALPQAVSIKPTPTVIAAVIKSLLFILYSLHYFKRVIIRKDIRGLSGELKTHAAFRS